MNTTNDDRFLQRRAALALVAVGGLALAGCAESSRTAVSAAGNIDSESQVGGPDSSAGFGQATHIRVVTGTASTAAANDFALGNESILAGFDAVGFDQAALQSPVIASVFTKGAPMVTVVAPTGGNLVDLGVRGLANDQLPIKGQTFLGVVGFQFDGATPSPVLNNPFNNLIANFEILTDLDPGAGALGVNFSENIRRVITRGVVMGLSGSTNKVTLSTIKNAENFLSSPFPGTSTATKQTSVAAIKAAFAAAGGAVPASLALPQGFIDNLPDAFSIVTVANTALGLDVPIYVNTIYSIRSGTNYMTMTTVVVNLGSSAVAFAGMADLWNTGAFTKNNDVLAATQLFASRDLHLTSFTTTAVPVATIPPDTTSPSPNDPPSSTFFSGAPQGVAPWVTFLGRDEPGVSYTEFDPNAGQVGFNRPATAFAGVIQPGATTINPNGGTAAWLRNISVGARNDAASSSDHAVATLAASTVRANPATGLPLPNSIVSANPVEGHVTGAGPHGGVVTIDEISPALIFTGPAAPTNKFLPVSAATAGAVTSIRRCVARFGEDGHWVATLPSGIEVHPGFAFPATATATQLGVRYRIQALTDGGGQSTTATFDLAFRQTGDIHAPTLDVTNLATFGFRVVDDTLNVATPARLTFKGRNGTLDPDLSIPSGLNPTTRKARISANLPSDFIIPGLNIANAATVAMDVAEGFERVDPGSGNVYYTLTGEGSVRLPLGEYEVTATLGVEYGESATHPGGMVQIISVGASGASAEFSLARAFTPTLARTGDFHVHASASADSSAPTTHKLAAYVASGIEIVAGTDHDIVSDYDSAFAELANFRPDLGRRVNVVNGTESTAQLSIPGLFTQSIGHYNAFPLIHDALKRKAGAPEDEFRPPAVLYGQLRALAPGGLANIVQLNHPRSRLGSLPIGGEGILMNLAYQLVPSAATSVPAAQAAGSFPTAFVDASSPSEAGLSGSSALFSTFALLGVDFRGSPDPDPATGRSSGTPGAHGMNVAAIDLMNKGSLLRLLPGSAAALAAAGSTLGGAFGFDTIELMTGAAMEDVKKYLDMRVDWFNMLNAGIIRTAVANSDSHRIGVRGNLSVGNALTGQPLSDEAIGFPRNYVLFKGGAPLAGAVPTADLVASLGKAFDDASTWVVTPPSTVDISELPKRLTGGRNVCSSGPYIDFQLKGTNAANAAVSGIVGDMVNLTGTAMTISVRIERAAWVPVDQLRIVVNGSVAVTVSAATVFAVQGASSRFEVPISFAAINALAPGFGNRDMWVVVEAGQTLADLTAGTAPVDVPFQAKFSDILPGGYVNSFTNPIFVDRDNNGTWRPPVDTTP